MAFTTKRNWFQFCFIIFYLDMHVLMRASLAMSIRFLARLMTRPWLHAALGFNPNAACNHGLWHRYMCVVPDISSCNLSKHCLIFSERELTLYARLSSVCRLSVCLFVCNAREPYSAGWNFGNVSTPFGILAIRWHPRKILRRSLRVKRRRGSQI